MFSGVPTPSLDPKQPGGVLVKVANPITDTYRSTLTGLNQNTPLFFRFYLISFNNHLTHVRQKESRKVCTREILNISGALMPCYLHLFQLFVRKKADNFFVERKVDDLVMKKKADDLFVRKWMINLTR